MDVMERRRVMMTQMASKSILDGLIEVADVFEPTVETNEHSFNYGGVLGGYFLVSSPAGLIKNKDIPQFSGDKNYINSLPFYIIRWGGTLAAGSRTAATVRPDYEKWDYYDYWTVTMTLDDMYVDITLSGNIKFKVGVKYYLLRVKQ